MKTKIIKLSIHPYRRNKGVKLPPKPITRSKYAQLLFLKGAGFNDK